MLGYTKACQVCLIFFHPRDDKLYLEKKQIIGKKCMQKTYFSDSFRFGSIQCVKRTVVKCFKSDSCATQMYNLVKGKVKHISGFFTITYHKSQRNIYYWFVMQLLNVLPAY